VGNVTRRELAEKQRRNKRIRSDDVTYLRETTGDQIIYSPYAQRVGDVKGNNQVYEGASIIGSAYNLPEIRDVPIIDGRYFTETEERMRKPVAIIGQDIREALFIGQSPIGKAIRLEGIEFEVIGLLEKQGSSFGRSLDNPVYIPMSMFNSMFGGQRGSAVFATARPESGLQMEEALDITRSALRVRFHTPVGEADNFDTLTPDSVRSFVDQILGVISAVVVPVTAISLVVGGVVIMNIMLVSVTERTREIGVRKSLGARQNDILMQFLTEAVILSLAGGMLGLAVGAVVAFGLSAAFGTTLKITLPYVLLSIVVSTTTGMVSGWYPAWRAARLNPVDALRAE
jgi:putative ABC transport system permease protein